LGGIFGVGCRWFALEGGQGESRKPKKPHRSGRVAQLVRTPASHAGGHRFESCRAHHRINTLHPQITKTALPFALPLRICRLNRSHVYCGHGGRHHDGSPFGTSVNEQPELTCLTSRFRPKSRTPVTAGCGTGRLGQTNRSATRRKSLGRLFPSVDDGCGWPAGAPAKGEDPWARVDAQARGTKETR
jgi:hypothetical protein